MRIAHQHDHGIRSYTIALPFCHSTFLGKKPLPASYPKKLRTLGDHVRKRRLDLRLLQREVAALLSVSKSTLEGWEQNRHAVGLRQVPAVIRFLGYVPFPEPVTLAERLRLYRTLNGISRRELAQRLRMDESTVWRWEANLGVSRRHLRTQVSAFLDLRSLAPKH